jgi:hypothetical protein
MIVVDTSAIAAIVLGEPRAREQSEKALIQAQPTLLFFSAALMRVCQPRPVDLNRSITSRSSRKVMETLRSALSGLPKRLTMPAPCADMSGAASGSAAIPRAISASSMALGRRSLVLIIRHLPTIGLSGGNDAALAAALDEYDHVQTGRERRNADQSRLAIVPTPILKDQCATPIQSDQVPKVDAMVRQIAPSLVFVPGRHQFT